jgi:hypothetical protein
LVKKATNTKRRNKRRSVAIGNRRETAEALWRTTRPGYITSTQFQNKNRRSHN